ncbi:DUF4374 domain-containing protein [Apibacter raozihei]|uniref:DUF4374 domain-containing protein n=1 Tax=Apibacter raozihei TaxID=2500547 RepID=UPI000FE40F36|nr:DUF4374 domain-containing protein [Apibacter raozihei]
MKTCKLIQKVLLSTLVSYISISCSNDDSTSEVIPQEVKGKFVISSAPGTGSLGTGTYFLTVDGLDSGTDAIVENSNAVKTTSSFTQIVVNNSSTLMGFIYPNGSDLGQGQSGARAFKFGTDNKMVELQGSPFPTGRFTVTGSFGNFIYAVSSTDNSYLFERSGDNVTMMDKPIDFESHKIGEEKATITGIADRGNNEIVAAFKYASVDEAVVAIMDYNFTIKSVIQDARMSYSGGQWRGAVYSQIASEASGLTYVFSGAGSGNATTKKAGALKINKGENSFDTNYFFDIETASGGYKFRKVFPVSNDYYLLEFYNDTTNTGNTANATRYAIVKMSSKEFKWVEGLPAYNEISSNGWPLAYEGKMYLPINPVSGKSAVYVINPVSGNAVKGFEINNETEQIRAVSYFK